MLVEGYLDTLYVHNLVTGNYTYIIENTEIVKNMFNSLSEDQQKKALKAAGPLQFYRSYDKMESSLMNKYSMGTPVELWNFMFDDIAKSLSVNSLKLYNGQEIVEEISNTAKTIEKVSQSNKVNGMTLKDMLNFFTYLCENSTFEETQTDEYKKFLEGIDFLVKN